MTRKILAALVGLLVAAGVSATSPVPFLNASSGGSGGFGPGGESVIWALDATAADDITAANVKGPPVTVTRAGTGKTRITSTGTFENLSANVLLRDYIGNGAEFMVAGFNVENAHTNLVLQSEDFSTTWVNAGTPTFSANTTTLGSANLDTLGDDSAVAAEGKTQTITFTGNAVKVCSFVIKQGTSTSTVVRLRDTTALADRLLAAVTWSGGLPVVTMTTGTLRGVDKLASSSFRVRVETTSVTAANVNSLEYYPATDSALLITNTGDAQIGGMQCENSTLSHSYTPTTTATVTVNADSVTRALSGIDGVNTAAYTLGGTFMVPFIEASTSSERGALSVDDAGPNNFATISITATSDDFDASVFSGGGSVAALDGAAVTSGSFYKAYLSVAANDFAYSTQGGAAATDVVGAAPVSPTTIHVGARYDGSGGLDGYVEQARLYNRALDDADLAALTEPDPIWAWDAGSLGLVPYIGVGTPTITRAGNTATVVDASGNMSAVNANLPRFDYDPATRSLKGLLVEEARTNLVTNGNATGSAPGTPGTMPTTWDVINTAGLTRSVVGSGTESGVPYVDVRFNGTASAGSVAIVFIYTVSPVAPGDVFSLSNYVKLQSGSLSGLSSYQIGVDWGSPAYNGSARANVAAPTSAGLAQQRPASVLTAAPASTTQINAVLWSFAVAGGASVDATFRVGAAQLERGSFATSYIPTAGATVTRAADAITVSTTAMSGFSATTLTMFAEAYASLDNTAGAAVFNVDDGDSTDRVVLLYGSANNARTLISTASVTQADLTSAVSTWPSATVKKTAVAAAANDAAAAVGGSVYGTDTSVTMPALTTASIGSRQGGTTGFWNAPIRSLRLYNVRKSNAQLQALTAP